MRKYQIYGPEFKKQAHQVFESMRLDEPVFRQAGLDGKTEIFFVTAYDLVDQILRDDKRFVRDITNALTPQETAALPQQDPLLELIGNHMLNKDGTDHRRLRNLVSQAFTPRMVENLRPRIEAIASELLDRMQPQGQADLVNAYAFPLPITVIAELMGIPLEDQELFREWSNSLISPSLTPDTIAKFMADMKAFVDYLTHLFEQRAQHPTDDLTSALLQASLEGDRLSQQELFSMVVLLIVAGHETTVNLITNAALALLQNPTKANQLRQNPQLMPAAIEEFIRYDGPVERVFVRYAAQDLELGGVFIARARPVIGIIAAANRDPAKFSNPHQLNFERGNNPHLGFGKGAHYCLGAPLARLESEIALRALLERLPNLRLLDGDLEYRDLPMFKSLVRLPVGWDV